MTPTENESPDLISIAIVAIPTVLGLVLTLLDLTR